MRFREAFVRGTRVGPVPDAEMDALAGLLAERPAEVVLSAQGATRGREHFKYCHVAGTLARRNIRSLLSRNRSAAEIATALKSALTAAPRDAEYILEDAELELNLRDSIYAAPDAVIRLEGSELVISDSVEATISMPRTEIREQGRQYFGAEALARLVSLPISAIKISATAVLPVYLQLALGAVLEPDTAHERLQKGDWRSTRKPDFAKQYCITCARCFIHCPDNAIVHAMFDKAAKDTTGILGIDYQRCTACGICASVCPTDRNGYKSIVMIDAAAEGTPEVHHVA